MIRLSIIIPVYNLEQYIETTVQSCLMQNISLEEYEIICVNDGSKDCSGKVIQKIAQEYSNIRLIEQENAGVSAARNVGLAAAKGSCVWFVDGDDKIAENCLRSLLNAVEECNADIFWFQMTTAKENVSLETSVDTYEVCAEQEKKFSFMSSKGGVGGGVCCHVYRTAFLKKVDLRFSQDIKYSEDVLFDFKALMAASICAKTDSVLYVYYQREGSAMHSDNLDAHIQSMYLLAKEYNDIANDKDKEGWKEIALSKKAFAVKALLFSLMRKGNVLYAKEAVGKLKAEKLYPFPFLKESLRGNVTKKQAIINYVSFFFPWKWYFMLCVRLSALKNKLSRKNR